MLSERDSDMAGKVMLPVIQSVIENEGVVECKTGPVSKNEVIGRVFCGYRKVSPEILFDFGKKVTGYLEIQVKEHSNDWIHLWYGPTLDCMHMHMAIKMPHCGVFQSEHYIACRYIKLSIETDSIQSQDVFAELLSLKLYSSQYPCSYVGNFVCDDDLLNTIWRRGVYTTELCMQKQSEACWYRMKDRPEFLDRFSREWKGRYSDYVLFDGPRRDREAWLGDIRTEALTVYTAFAAYDICKSSIDIFADLQRKDGSTVGDASNWMNFTEYNFWGIIAVWENYLYTGDRNFLEHIYPFIKNLISFIDSRMDERGFIYNDSHWMWTLPREGYNAGTQMILFRALECAALIEKEMYDAEESKRLQQLSVQVKEQINCCFWNEEKGVYEDSLRLIIQDMPVLLDVNCYAVIFNVADEQQAKRILHYLKENMWSANGSTTLDHAITNAELEKGLTFYPLRDLVESACDSKAELLKLMYPHNKTVWPFINGYEVEARLKTGDIDNAFTLIKQCWGQEYFNETDTFWEFVDPKNPVFNSGSCYYLPKDDCYNSAAHGWSGWISYLMQSYILGIMPLKAGFKEAKIEPQTGSLQKITGRVPTPNGIIFAEITKDENIYQLYIEKPKTVSLNVHLTKEELKGRKQKVTMIDR